MATGQTFKKTWRGWTISSEGYAVWVGSRTGIHLRDAGGQIRIASEAMASGALEDVGYE